MDPATNISELYSKVAPGQNSDQVKQLQTALIGAGFNIGAGATGFYGPQTQSAVDAWKKTLGGTDTSTAKTGTSVATADSNAGFSTFSLPTPTEPSTDLIKYTSFDEIKKMIDEANAGVNATLTPTDKEKQLTQQIADIRAKEDQLMQDQKQSDIYLQGEGISNNAIQGRSEADTRITNMSLDTLALQEKNLLTRLGLEQDARTVAEKIATNKLTSVKDLVTTASQMQDKINEQKTALVNETDKLTDNTRQTLSTILSQFKGLDFHSLSTDAQLQLQSMANKLGIPIDVIIQGMQVVKNQQDLDNLNKAKSLAIDQQNANRLSNQSNNMTDEEKAFQDDLNKGITNLASNKQHWGEVYDTLAGIYGHSNPDLVRRLTPQEITAAGGDPSIDETYLDILLNKKKYYNQ